MAFEFQTREEKKLSTKTDVQGVLQGSNPFFPNGFLNAIASAMGLRWFDSDTQVKELLKQIFWDTADGIFLERAASYFKITFNAATQSTGNVVAQGTAGTVIPTGQSLTLSGVAYTSQVAATISSLQVFVVSSLTRSGATATVTTSIPHNQATGLVATMAGADQVEYNGTFSIIVTSPTEFTYTVAGTPVTPATGTITASFQATLTLTSLNRGGTIVTAETATPHNQATGVTVVIGGADQPEYNGTFIIVVVSTTRFTYTLTGILPVTPATTGTVLLGAFATAVVPVSADLDSIGAAGNQDSGALLTFTAPPAGIQPISFVDFNGLTGGNDIETSDELRSRFLQRVQNPVANFNKAVVENTVLSVAGNTRVFVQEVTPAKGQVTIYFARDNDDIIPTPDDVTRTKDEVLTIKPANTASDDVFVLAPTAKTVDFSFSAINPSTTTMQDAIRTSLTAFFAENTDIGTDIPELAYQSALFNVIDIVTGDRLLSFTLTTPVGNISVAAGELPVLGVVSFT